MYGLALLLERQADVQADRLAAGFARAAVGRFHDAGAAARGDDEAVVLRLQRVTPCRQQPRQLSRVLVVARPFDRLARSRELGLELRVGVLHAAGAQRLQRAFGALAAVDAGRSEKHDRVLDFLLLEASQRFEVFGENAYRTGFGAFEKLLKQVRERLRHAPAHSIRCYDRPS